jgi:hypothetical protein
MKGTSGYIPKIFGILLIVAGLGNVTDSFGKFLFSGYNISVSQFTFIGELALIFWLLIKGVKVQHITNR